jgi:tetratricopeptide (TPR) repeat protein
MGYVYADSQGRESFYELQEPLMRICLEAKKRRGTPNQLFISFLRVWFSREELEKRLEILPLEAIFDRECTLQALAEMETSDDPKVAALLREWDDAWKNLNYKKILEASEELTLIRGSGMDWIKRAQACYLTNQKNQVIQFTNKAIEIEPNNADIWCAIASFKISCDLFFEAVETINKSINIDPCNPLIWSLKAYNESMLKQKSKAQHSIEYAVKLLEANRDNLTNVTVFENAAFVYREIGNKTKSEYYLDKLLEIEPENDRAWRCKAANYMNLMNLDNKKSLEYAQKAIDINPNSHENYQTLAAANYLMKNYKIALEKINKSIKLFDSDSRSWMIKGGILASLNEDVMSLECLHKVLILNTSFPDSPGSAFSEIAQNSMKMAPTHIFNYIFKKDTTSKKWLKDSQLILEIYAEHNLLNDLSGGLVESIKAVNEPSISDHTAQAWLEMWQNLAGHYPEFQVVLNLLKVAVEYKINRDRRVLLQLPQEERQILEELLNPETI